MCAVPRTLGCTRCTAAFIPIDLLPLPRQLRLDLSQPDAVADWPLVVTSCNRVAVEAVNAWPDFPNGALALVGPEGSGKSRLARSWASRSDAAILGFEQPDFDALADRPALIDDAEGAEGETLFHLLNRAAAGGGSLLLTGRTPPLCWRAEVPDLRSRLNALAVAELGEPDDEVLDAVLRGLLRIANIRPGPELLPYLISRIERSAGHARRVVEQLDAVAAETGREITPRLARRVLDAVDTPDLFE